MRRILTFCFLFLAPAALFAGSLSIRVVDPQQRTVPGARVSVYPESGPGASQTGTTAADGSYEFKNLPDGAYKLQVLAPGFAQNTSTVQVPAGETKTVPLVIGGGSETVVVSAASTPISEAESGTAVSIVDSRTLEIRNPATLSDAIRFAPGVLVSANGQRGALTSLNIRGGESRYNKVIVDGVSVTEPGGFFDLGVVPASGIDRIELVRGSESAVYGSDAMSGVLQTWSITGHTPVPEFLFGADGGNFGTGHGYGSLSGARGRYDFNLFADQFNTNGQGTNNSYSNSLQGANIGIRLDPRVQLRFRTRHSNSFSGVSNEWSFNGSRYLSPDKDQRARQNNFLADLDLTIAGPGSWQHRVSGYEYNHVRHNVDSLEEPARENPDFFLFDSPFDSKVTDNRAGFGWQSDYSPRSWLRSSLGYNFDDENALITNDFVSFGTPGDLKTNGLRLNNSVFLQQMLLWKRFSLLAGANYINSRNSFPPQLQLQGTNVYLSRVVPRAALTYLVRGGKGWFGDTRLRGVYGEGIVEPGFEQSFGITGTFPTLPNANLKAEQNRSFEAGFDQSFADNRFSLSGTYFRNQFRDQIQYQMNPDFTSQYININRSLAHGAEVELQGRLSKNASFMSSYTYTATQVLRPSTTRLGEPLLHRPRHFGSLSMNYVRSRWGGNVSGVAVGRRPDDDFLFGAVPPVHYAAGYARVDASGYYTVNSRVTAYANIENLLNHHYNEVVGYPALGFSFRTGLRFRIGGE